MNGVKVLLLLIACVAFIGAVGAADLAGAYANTAISLSHGLVVYNDTLDGYSLQHTTLIDGGVYNPTYVGPSVMSTAWGTGTNASTSDVLLTYAYNMTGVLKGTIVLKSPHTIQFPMQLPTNEQIITGQAGTLAIVGNDPV